MLEAESGGRFDTRLCVLGHLQQGGRPSPADRIDGARLGAAACDQVIDHPGAALVGLRGGGVEVTPIAAVLAAADLHRRRARQPEYEGILRLARAFGVG